MIFLCCFLGTAILVAAITLGGAFLALHKLYLYHTVW